MLAALNWLSALKAIDCLLPVVFNEMLELKPAALATTWKLPPPPRPWMVPPTFRLLSLQVPETSPPWATPSSTSSAVPTTAPRSRHATS